MMLFLFGAIVAAYVMLDLIVACSAAIARNVRCGLWSLVVFPLIHTSYGLGYLKGLLDFLILQKGEPHDSFALPLSR